MFLDLDSLHSARDERRLRLVNECYGREFRGREAWAEYGYTWNELENPFHEMLSEGVEETYAF